MEKILLPRTGLTQEEGTIVEWKVEEGDVFSEGDVLAVMESEKSTNEVIADFSGRLVNILVGVDGTCTVGEPIAEAERL